MSDLSPALRVPHRHSLLPHFLSGKTNVGGGGGALNYIVKLFSTNFEYMCPLFVPLFPVCLSNFLSEVLFQDEFLFC